MDSESASLGRSGRIKSPVSLSYRHLSGVTVLATYLVMLFGAYTSAIGAGLSCPDWPTCYGTMVPFLHPEIIANSPYSALQIFAEWFHRGLAFVTGFLILGTAVSAWRRHRDEALIVWPAVAAIILLPIQVLLGGLTVTRDLQPFIVTPHLGVAILILCCLLTTFLAATLVRRA